MAVGSIVAAGISAGVSIYQGQQAKDAAEFNADLMGKEADFAKTQSIDQAAKLRDQGEAFKGDQQVAIAASGIKSDTGSPLQILKETQDNLNKDVLNINQQGLNAQKQGYNQADFLRKQGNDARGAAIISGTTSFATNLIGIGIDKKWWGE